MGNHDFGGRERAAGTSVEDKRRKIEALAWAFRFLGFTLLMNDAAVLSRGPGDHRDPGRQCLRSSPWLRRRRCSGGRERGRDRAVPALDPPQPVFYLQRGLVEVFVRGVDPVTLGLLCLVAALYFVAPFTPRPAAETASDAGVSVK